MPGRRAGRLRERQADFAAAILDPGRPVPDGIVAPDGEPSAKRFAVYRNNVVVGLTEALEAAFPAVRRIVGSEFFAAMARVYVARELPGTPVMLDYGKTFADFIDGFEPAAVVPYLADVARLERAWLESYHAAEAQPVDPARLLGRIGDDRLPELGFVLHPSLRIVPSPFPVVRLWRMNVEGGTPRAIALDGGGEHALVIRPEAEVEVRSIARGTAAFVRGLAAGLPVGGAARRACDDDPAFDLAAALGGLLELGGIAGWRLPGESRSP